MKILITAFEPFGQRTVNASLSVLDQLPETFLQTDIVKAVISVDLHTAPTQLRDLLDKEKPDAVICMGEAGGIDWIQLEHVAINWMNFRIPDNSGVIVEDAKINPNGQNAYFGTLPLRKFESTLKEAQIPVKISMTAGTYLCNLVFYKLMEGIEENHLAIPGGFIHLPAASVGNLENPIHCDLDKCVAGVRAILGDFEV